MRQRQDTRNEEHIGQRDLTRWSSAAGRGLVRLALVLARYVSAHAVLVVTAVAGALLVTGLTAGSAEIYDAVEEGDGISQLDRPVLNAAIGLRTVTNTHVVTAFTHLGGPIGMTVIAGLITLVMTLAWCVRR